MLKVTLALAKKNKKQNFSLLLVCVFWVALNAKCFCVLLSMLSQLASFYQLLCTNVVLWCMCAHLSLHNSFLENVPIPHPHGRFCPPWLWDISITDGGARCQIQLQLPAGATQYAAIQNPTEEEIWQVTRLNFCAFIEEDMNRYKKGTQRELTSAKPQTLLFGFMGISQVTRYTSGVNFKSLRNMSN